MVKYVKEHRFGSIPSLTLLPLREERSKINLHSLETSWEKLTPKWADLDIRKLLSVQRTYHSPLSHTHQIYTYPQYSPHTFLTPSSPRTNQNTPSVLSHFLSEHHPPLSSPILSHLKYALRTPFLAPRANSCLPEQTPHTLLPKYTQNFNRGLVGGVLTYYVEKRCGFGWW